MLTIDGLRDFGANVDEGLGRCVNNEAFYLRMVSLAVKDAGFDRLAEAVESDDRNAAFEAAHSLKGVLGNLALTPLYVPVSEMTELLRDRRDADYAGYLARILDQRAKLQTLID